MVELEIRQDSQRVYWFRDVQQQTDESLLIPYSKAIPNQAGMQAEFKLDRPFKEFEYSMKAMFGISLGIFIVVFGLWYSIRWLRQQLRGAELLAERAQLILDGKLTKRTNTFNDFVDVARGLIERKPHPHDGRAVGLHATPKGQALMVQAEQTATELETEKTAKLTPAERKTLVALLQKIYL